MKTALVPVVWLTGVGVVGALVVGAVWGAAVQPEVWLGLAGPLVSAVVSWVLMVQAAGHGQDRLMALMIKALAAKMVLVGAYVATVLLAWDMRPVPFVATFTGFFIVFHAMEALFLKRLVMRTSPA